MKTPRQWIDELNPPYGDNKAISCTIGQATIADIQADAVADEKRKGDISQKYAADAINERDFLRHRDSVLREVEKYLVCAEGDNVLTMVKTIVTQIDMFRGFCLQQHQMLRAFRYSMDTDKAFPSQEKLDEIIKQMEILTL